MKIRQLLRAAPLALLMSLTTAPVLAQTQAPTGRDSSAMKRGDYAGRDQATQVAALGILDVKTGLTLEQFDRYWRDVHGPLAARIPGFYQYWQHHLASTDSGIWPRLSGIEYDCPPEDQMEGVAEVTFRSVEDQSRAAASRTWSLLMVDEQNVFDRTFGYLTDSGNSRTLKDGIEDGAPNGGQDIVRWMVFLRKSNRASVDDFRRYIKEGFAPSLAKSEHLLKLRVHLLNKYGNDYDPQSVNVKHDKPLEKQYQAALEIVFKDSLGARRFFASKEYAATVKDQPRYIQALHTFPVRDTYTLVYNGRMTLAGQRTSPVADLITQLGAANHMQEDVLKLFIGQGEKK